MAGRISFHFDDGHLSHYKQAFPVFQKAGVSGCIALVAGSYACDDNEEASKQVDNRSIMSITQALEMQAAGWEILGHSMNHNSMREPLEPESAFCEIAESKRLLEARGFRVRQFVTPMSECHPDMIPLLQEHYEGAFTVYTNSASLPVEKLVMERPVSGYRMHRACLAKHTPAQLQAYVDYVADRDEWLVFYDHDLGVNGNITAPMLYELLEYCKRRGVEVLTSSDAMW